MPAPANNQFWKLRSKHGREKLFTTPDLLWTAACEYFQWCDEHPWKKVEQLKQAPKPVRFKNGKVKFPDQIVHLPTQRPYTITGLCLFLDASKNFWDKFRKACVKNESEDFLGIIARVEDIIYTQKFEGAAVGAFNANIIARDLGLRENNDITTKGEKLPEPAAATNALSDAQFDLLINTINATAKTG